MRNAFWRFTRHVFSLTWKYYTVVCCMEMLTTLILSVSIFSCHSVKVVKNFLHRSQIILKIANLNIRVLDFFHASPLLPHCGKRVPKKFLEGEKTNKQTKPLHLKHRVVQRIISRKIHSSFLVLMRLHKLLRSLEQANLFLWVQLACSVGWHKGNKAIILLHSYFLWDGNPFVLYVCITRIWSFPLFSVPICPQTKIA